MQTHTHTCNQRVKNRYDSFIPLITGHTHTHSQIYAQTQTHTHSHTPLLIGCCPSVGEAFIPGYMDDGANTWGPSSSALLKWLNSPASLPVCLSFHLLMLCPCICVSAVCFCLTLSDDSLTIQVEILRQDPARVYSADGCVCLFAFTHVCISCG